LGAKKKLDCEVTHLVLVKGFFLYITNKNDDLLAVEKIIHESNSGLGDSPVVFASSKWSSNLTEQKEPG